MKKQGKVTFLTDSDMNSYLTSNPENPAGL